MFLRWLPAVVISVFIFWLSAQTGPQLKTAGLDADDVHIIGHFWMFFFLCAAFYRGTKNVLVSIILSVIYAFTDEYHQKSTFGRSSSFGDILNDSVAAMVAGALIWSFYQKLPKILKNWLKA